MAKKQNRDWFTPQAGIAYTLPALGAASNDADEANQANRPNQPARSKGLKTSNDLKICRDVWQDEHWRIPLPVQATAGLETQPMQTPERNGEGEPVFAGLTTNLAIHPVNANQVIDSYPPQPATDTAGVYYLHAQYGLHNSQGKGQIYILNHGAGWANFFELYYRCRTEIGLLGERYCLFGCYEPYAPLRPDNYTIFYGDGLSGDDGMSWIRRLGFPSRRVAASHMKLFVADTPAHGILFTGSDNLNPSGNRTYELVLSVRRPQNQADIMRSLWNPYMQLVRWLDGMKDVSSD